MELNLEAIKELVKDRFRGKLTYLANELDIDYSYLNQVINGKRSPTSKKICNKVIKYCINNGLDYQKYVFVPLRENFNSKNLALIKLKNNYAKICIENVKNQMEETLEYIKGIDELIEGVRDEIN